MRYEYDLDDRLSKITMDDGYALTYSYALDNTLSAVKESFAGLENTTRYVYNKDAMTTKAMLENAEFICTVEGVHVSVMPAGGVAALNDWKASYDSAETDPHELTLLLYSITW